MKMVFKNKVKAKSERTRRTKRRNLITTLVLKVKMTTMHDYLCKIESGVAVILINK